MDLTTAVRLVGDDTRADTDPSMYNMTDAEAVAYTRDPVTGCQASDIARSVDDPDLREAYYAVLGATDAELAQVTA